MQSEIKTKIKNWLFNSCLPIWWEKGADFEIGGFYERLNLDLSPDNINRRTRVAARQIYSYAKAELMGYQGETRAPIQHGLNWLYDKCLREDGYFYAVLGPKGEIIRPDFDLYDHAFIMMSLAYAYQVTKADDLKAKAEIIRDKILADYSHPNLGFEETIPRNLPLKANPHMHMLEACLAWVDIGEQGKWRKIAEDIINLAQTKFLDENGVLHEYFDGDWNIIKGDKDLIEPGHQFEWAWLFLRWAKISKDETYIAIARSLIEIGEIYGVDNSRNVSFNSLQPDLTTFDFTARLWPQTERIKAYCELAQLAPPHEKKEAEKMAFLAYAGLDKYFQTEIIGLYGDRMDEKGEIIKESAPASTLYHIICALDALMNL